MEPVLMNTELLQSHKSEVHNGERSFTLNCPTNLDAHTCATRIDQKQVPSSSPSNVGAEHDRKRQRNLEGDMQNDAATPYYRDGAGNTADGTKRLRMCDSDASNDSEDSILTHASEQEDVYGREETVKASLDDPSVLNWCGEHLSHGLLNQPTKMFEGLWLDQRRGQPYGGISDDDDDCWGQFV
mmetsp:Transcript_77812/g.155828  ORF Transcript_77812/g.155828 Transcript_77812/m.155828 type:complete len:184 (+) Transcript_77812:50-601(+)